VPSTPTAETQAPTIEAEPPLVAPTPEQKFLVAMARVMPYIIDEADDRRLMLTLRDLSLGMMLPVAIMWAGGYDSAARITSAAKMRLMDTTWLADMLPRLCNRFFGGLLDNPRWIGRLLATTAMMESLMEYVRRDEN